MPGQPRFIPDTKGTTVTMTPLPPCRTEDSDNCYWDAFNQGNGDGMTFITYRGETTYLEAQEDPLYGAYGSAERVTFITVPPGDPAPALTYPSGEVYPDPFASWILAGGFVAAGLIMVISDRWKARK